VDDFGELVGRLGLNDLGGWSFVRRLGAGGQGAVCLYEMGGEQVACKLLIAPQTEADIRRLREEARTLLAVRQFGKVPGCTRPSVVAALSEVAQVPGLPVYYFLMELAQGETLAALMRRDAPPWPWRRAIEIVWRTASALSIASALGHVHRDLHPGNIVVDQARFRFDPREGDGDPGVTVIDFGVQRDVLDDHFLPEVETPHTFRPVGSVSYLSPEGLEEPQHVTTSSDAWSLGVILFQLITGKKPFHAATLVKLIEQTKAGLPALPTVPNASSAEQRFVDEVLKGLLTPDHVQRLSSPAFRAMASDLLYRDLLTKFPGPLDDYYEARGDLWFCATCKGLRKFFGVRCTGCGRSDVDGPGHWSDLV